jgi:hypothetical protein
MSSSEIRQEYNKRKDENKLKYKNLSIVIQRRCNMECFVKPVVTGATTFLLRE